MGRKRNPAEGITIERVYNENGDNGAIFNGLIRAVFKGMYPKKVFQEKEDMKVNESR